MMSILQQRGFSALGILVLLSVCVADASAQREELLLSSRPPPKNQPCSISPDTPPSLDELVDSAGFADDLVHLWSSGDATKGSVLLSLAVDSTGTLPRPPGVIETDQDDLTAAIVADFLAQRARAIDGFRYVRVKVNLDSVPDFQVGRSETCRPALTNEREVLQYVAGAGRQAKSSGTVGVRVFVSGSGTITDIKIGTTSGDELLDKLAMSIAKHMRFEPARVDYVPVATWVEIPVTINKRCQPGAA